MTDVEKICRTCMKRDVPLVNLFGPLKIENNTFMKLADVLMEATPLQITKEDGLPQNVCDECVESINIMYIFRTQALYSESELKKLIIPKIKNETDNDDEAFNDDIDRIFTYNGLTNDDVINQDAEEKLQIYNCVSCKQKYTDYDKYLKHISVHDIPSKTCLKCKAIFNRKSLLKDHMKKNDCIADKYENIESQIDNYPKDLEFEIKLEDEAYKCSDCSMSFQTQECLVSHVKEHIKNNMLKQKLINSLQTHSETQEKLDSEIKVENTSGQFKCAQCNLVFEKYRSLLSHSKKHNNKPKNCVFKCDYCNRGFNQKGPLKRHLLLHTVERPYKCDQCSKSYVRRDALLAHMRKHSDSRKYVCNHCNKAFVQLCTLKDHIRTHTGETPFLCSECGRGFKNSSNLRQHLARHTGIKPFACTLCPKSFCTKGQMKCHLASHSNVQPYKCDECGASFTKAHSLKKHQLIHLGLKPFACDSCNMRFSGSDHLKRHQRTHTGEKPYRCPHCARAYTQSNDLAKHVRAHVGQNIYQCTVCQAKFRLMKELRLHYPVHYTTAESTTLMDNDAPLVILKGCSGESIDNNISKTETDAQITITFNRNILDKDGSGDITINIAPDKVN